MIEKFEAPASPEKPPLYEKTVFGHWFHEFDRDQFLTYYLALRGGVVSASSGFEFTPKVKELDLKDPKVFVVEGVPDGYKGVNSKDTGNFDNNPLTDAPAVAEFAQQCRDEFLDTFTPYAVDIARWARSAETGKKLKKQLKLLQKDDLDLATKKVFYGLKLQFADDKDGFLLAAVQMMDTVLNPSRTSSVAELYQEEIRLAQQAEAEARNRLMEKATQSEAIRAITTDTGVGLVMFDVRGTNTDSGAPGIAQAHAEANGVVPHLMMIVGDAKDDNGNIIGNKVLLKVPKTKEGEEESSLADLREILGDRLNHVEALFGNGYVAEFGGHPEVIASDRALGSGINPDELWVSLQGFFAVPRYTKDEFTGVAQSFARQFADINRVFAQSPESPHSPYDLPERHIDIVVSVDSERRLVSIPEADIPLYQKAFTEVCDGDQVQFRSLLAEKTRVSEHPAVAKLRLEQAELRLGDVLEAKNTDAALRLIEDLNPEHIRTMQPKYLAQLFGMIADNATAIDQIWNKDNLRFQIAPNDVLPWMRGNIEKYKAARYKALTLPKKIDRYVMERVHDLVCDDQTEAAERHRLLEQSVQILCSEAYTSSHQEKIYDRYLHSVLKVLVASKTNAALKDPAERLIDQIAAQYGSSQKAHWQRLADTDQLLFSQVCNSYPVIANLMSELDIQVEVGDPEFYPRLWSAVAVTPPDAAQIRASLEKQQEKGMVPPIVNAFFEVGRPVEHLIQEDGILRADGTTEASVVFAGAVKVEDLLDLSLGSQEADEMARVIVAYMKALYHEATTVDPTAKVRIITGGFPGQLATQMIAALDQAAGKGEMSTEEVLAIKRSLVFSNFNLQERRFIDRSYL